MAHSVDPLKEQETKAFVAACAEASAEGLRGTSPAKTVGPQPHKELGSAALGQPGRGLSFKWEYSLCLHSRLGSMDEPLHVHKALFLIPSTKTKKRFSQARAID